MQQAFWLIASNEFNAREFGLWVWLERISWIITAAGIPLLLYQFKVIADELTSRPKLELGLVPAGTPQDSAVLDEITVETTRMQSIALSEPVQVEFRAVNRGRRTARDLIFNFTVPPARAGGAGLVEVLEGPNVRQAKDGSVTMIQQINLLHPDAIQIIQMSLRLHSSVSKLTVQGTIAMADTPERAFSLGMRFREART